MRLEAVLETAPDDVRTRASLIGYYFASQAPEAVRQRNGHILWFIEHHPELHLSAFGNIDRFLSPEAYASAKQLWERVIKRRGDNTTILRRASDFFMIADIAFAEDLLRRGAALEPSVAHWHDRLAHLYLLVARHGDSPEQRMEAGRESLAEHEAALRLETSPVGRYCLMIDAATAAFIAKDLARATELAERVLAQASDFKGTWVYGNGVHHGHIILGRVALANDDVPTAREHLAAAGATPGSPQLNSFGPDQHLAVELLERGERDAVIAYADACKRFYGGGLGMLGAAYRSPD